MRQADMSAPHFAGIVCQPVGSARLARRPRAAGLPVGAAGAVVRKRKTSGSASAEAASGASPATRAAGTGCAVDARLTEQHTRRAAYAAAATAAAVATGATGATVSPIPSRTA